MILSDIKCRIKSSRPLNDYVRHIYIYIYIVVHIAALLLEAGPCVADSCLSGTRVEVEEELKDGAGSLHITLKMSAFSNIWFTIHISVEKNSPNINVSIKKYD